MLLSLEFLMFPFGFSILPCESLITESFSSSSPQSLSVSQVFLRVSGRWTFSPGLTISRFFSIDFPSSSVNSFSSFSYNPLAGMRDVPARGTDAVRLGNMLPIRIAADKSQVFLI